MKRSTKIVLWFVSGLMGVSVLAGLFFSAPHFLSKSFFIVQHPLEKADAIVVLSGGPMRFPHAMKLYKEDWAEKIVIAGNGFNGWWHRSAEQQGVPKDQLISFTDATTTREEALFCAEGFLDREEIQSIILVTSDYHSRRAYSEFKYQMPDLKIISSPSQSPTLLDFPKRREWYGMWWYFATRPFAG